MASKPIASEREEFDIELRQDAKALEAVLNTPRYPVGTVRRLVPDLSYRRINLWEKQGFFAPFRETASTGWRKFTFLEAVLILLISDLKQLGQPSVYLKHALATFIGLRFFQIVVTTTLRGMPQVVFFRSDGSFHWSHEPNLAAALRAVPSLGSFVYCPIHEYVRRVLELSGIQLQFDEFTTYRNLTREEVAVLRAIAKEDYDKVTLLRKNGKIHMIEVGHTLRGDLTPDDIAFAIGAGDYQEITLMVENGRIVVLRRNDRTRL